MSALFDFVRSSLILKISLVSFLCIHLPLIVAGLHILSGGTSDGETMLLLLLAATLAGTLACLGLLWWFIRPLRDLALAIDAYRQEGVVLPPPALSRDEIGLVWQATAAMTEELDLSLKRLRQLADSDPLTGLANRRALFEGGAHDAERALKRGDLLSLILFDLDHFKSINDDYGHEVGDQVLLATARTITANVRPFDMAARIGGEEFCIALPRTSPDQASAIAERLRVKLRGLEIPPLDQGRITASFGVAHSLGRRTGLKDLLVEADEALYAAKNAGRDRVICLASNVKDEG
ncbi:GGDEF domain-containing protein [Rhizobium paknamense]|uniref:diguanylate cyclase n=1 Tax=Rhizobium paknamense TaxID=1206817 RepID=A0ABU0IGJ1_9HYPH|nr:GGDEF domain-containing protein [Rhizobium paknamense]MDQ0456530.1 diguanylate cyclase (GGDEF)-like protein [Rhizobium paknamense]